MRGAATLGLLTLCAGVAHGDDEDGGEVRESAGLAEDHGWLDFDPVLSSRLEGVGATQHVDDMTVRLGPDLVAHLEGANWSSEDEPWRPELDLPTRGWRTALRVSRDLGFARLEGQAAVVDYDDTLARGRYLEAGIAVVKTFKLSRWMRAWISIGVGRKVWLGDAPDGESNDVTLGLSLGTTFR
jgi:hypothetical protein